MCDAFLGLSLCIMTIGDCIMEITHEEWASEQVWEKDWWQTTGIPQLAEEIVKQDRMARILNIPHSLHNTSVIDIGCGPLSMLLRFPCVYSKSAALDPMDYTYINMEKQYSKLGIKRLIKKGEDLTPEDGFWDISLMYNCLQHVQDPVKIIHNCLNVSDKLLIFEWTKTPKCPGHPHEISKELIEHAVGSKGGWAYTFRMEGEFCETAMFGKFYAAEFIRK